MFINVLYGTINKGSRLDRIVKGERLLTVNLRKNDLDDRNSAIQRELSSVLPYKSDENHLPVRLDDVLTSLSAMKSENQVIIPLNGKSSLVDHMIVVSGTSDTHVRAIADRLVRDLKNAGCGSYTPEFGQDDAWVLLDLGEIIVHIFKQETRELYALEKMWSITSKSSAENAITL